MRNPLSDRMEFDDIVFENRNKDYGAYPLRKKYNGIVVVSIFLAVLIFAASVLIPYFRYLSRTQRKGQEFRVGYAQLQIEKIEPPMEEIFLPPSPPPPASPENLRYVAPVVVDTIRQMEKTIPAFDDILVSPENEKGLINGFGKSKDQLAGLSGDISDEPYVIVEVPPSFRGGGLEKFRDWVQHKTVYPEVAQQNGIRGTVIILFIVERDGSVSNVKVVKSVNPLLDAEAVKAIESSPKWSPGIQRGEPVRVRFSIPLVFSLGR